MEPNESPPTNPPVKQVAIGLIAVVLLTMGMLVWFDSKGIPPEPTVSSQSGGAPPFLSFPFLDKSEYEEKENEIKVSYPSDVKALDGRTVAVAGFMAPYENLEDMCQFLLMPSSGGCFFCQPPSLTQVVMVRQALKLGVSDKFPFVPAPIIVTGKLHLRSKEDERKDAQKSFIYELSDAEIRPLSESAAQAAGLALGGTPISK